MRRALLLLSLLPVLAFAQAQPPPVGINSDAVINSLRLTSGLIYDSAGLTRVSIIAGASSIYTGRMPDGPTAVGHAFDTPAYADSGAKIASFRNNGSEKANVDKNGSFTSGGGFYGSSGTFASSGALSAVLRGGVADGATAVGVSLGNQTTLANASAKIARFCADTPNTCATERGYVLSGGKAVFNGGVQFASTGGAVTWFQTATHAAVDLASVATAACTAQTTETITGAALGDTCLVASGIAAQAGGFYVCNVTAADTVKWQFCNLSGGAIDRASDTYTIKVIR